MPKAHQKFSDFYPFYLSQHINSTCRRLHFIGSTLILFLIVSVFLLEQWMLLLWLPILGYGFAWAGHFFFEKNKPATFTYPIYSLMGDWVMFKDILIGKIKW